MSAIGSIDGGATVWAETAREITRATAMTWNDLKRDVVIELRKQDAKWGVQDHPAGDWSLILCEEIGEVSQAILQGRTVDAYNEIVDAIAVLVRIGEKVLRA